MFKFFLIATYSLAALPEHSTILYAGQYEKATDCQKALTKVAKETGIDDSWEYKSRYADTNNFTTYIYTKDVNASGKNIMQIKCYATDTHIK